MVLAMQDVLALLLVNVVSTSVVRCLEQCLIWC